MSAQFTGLPDFTSLAALGAGDTAAMFVPFGGVGSYAVLPEQLAVACDAAGVPKVRLEIEKSFGDLSGAGRWATFDLTVVGDYPLENALVSARSLTPGATVAPLTIDGGYARLYATTTVVTPLGDLLKPVSLGLGGENGARWTMRLSSDAGEILKAALEGSSAVPLGARVEYVASGVAPRVPVAVEFSPGDLVAALLAGNPSRMVAQSALLPAFAQPPGKLPLKVIGAVADQTAAFAQAMEGRLISTFAALTPAASVTDPAYFLFTAPASLDNTVVHWDLSEPAVVSRAWVILFDPLSSIRALTSNSGVDALVKYITVPPLQLGIWKIDLTTNLPSNRYGVAIMGATIEAPARPPFRPASVAKDVTFEEPEDGAKVELRLAMRELLEFTVTPYAVFEEAQAVRQDVGLARPCNANWVRLQQGDFPVRFVHISADPRLLALADIGVVLSYAFNGKAHQQVLTMTAAIPDVAVGMPRDAMDFRTLLTATPHDGSAALPVPAPTTDRIRLDLTSFPQYGPQKVDIVCSLSPTDAPVFIDLLPQCQLQNTTAVAATVLLTAEQPDLTWTYLATSPFQAGFCYRVSAIAGAPGAAWSKPFSAQSGLMLAADGSLATGDPNQPPAAMHASQI